MRNYLFAALLEAFCLCGCVTTGPAQDGRAADGAPSAFTSDDDFRNWFAFYYQDPHPERVTAAIHYMTTAGYLERQPEIASIFLAEVFASEPSRLKDWSNEWARLSPAAWNVVLVALWFSATDDARALVKQNAKKATGPFQKRVQAMIDGKAPTPHILTMAVTDPRQINIIWSAFSATGNVKYVEKVVSYIKLYGNEDDPVAHAIGEAALVTLATNVPLHKVVATICKDQDSSNPDEATRALLHSMFQILAQIAQEGQESPAH